MDKIQIYYTCLIAFGFIVMLVYTTTNTDLPSTPARALPLKWALGLALGMPIIGRIYGWW